MSAPGEPGAGPPAQSGHFMPTAAVRAQSGHMGVPHVEQERSVSRSGCQWHRASWMVASRGSSVTSVHGIPPTGSATR